MFVEFCYFPDHVKTCQVAETTSEKAPLLRIIKKGQVIGKFAINFDKLSSIHDNVEDHL